MSQQGTQLTNTVVQSSTTALTVVALTMVALAVTMGVASGCSSSSVRVQPEATRLAARDRLIPTFTPLPPATSTLTPIPSATPRTVYYTPTPDQFEAAAPPVHLEIPAIGVDASMEHVGRLPTGEVDVPRVPADVAWFTESALPGQYSTKTSIVSGHLDSPAGPAVFYRLRMLVPGDEMIVTYANGDRYVFVVEEKERYYHDSPPYQKLYGDGETMGRRLNLITCDGAWDRGSANYQQRLVVYTELNGEGQRLDASEPAATLEASELPESAGS